MEYPVLFEPSKEGGFVVTFPDFDWGLPKGKANKMLGKWRWTHCAR
jgi:hypothetical protein